MRRWWRNTLVQENKYFAPSINMIDKVTFRNINTNKAINTIKIGEFR